MADSLEGYGLAAPELPEVRILRLQPDDVLLLSTKRRLSYAEFDEIEKYAGAAFPGHRCAILEDGMTLDVLRKQEVVTGE